ncbi:MAG: hypothetical protein QW052_06195 [Candidatus Nitrosocaldaceae archaeon]
MIGKKVYEDMIKGCIFCGSKNVMVIDDRGKVVGCFDCLGIVSKGGSGVEVIYITRDREEAEKVKEIFEEIIGNVEVKEYVGYYIIRSVGGNISKGIISKILSKDDIDLNKVSIVFDKIKVEGIVGIGVNRLKECGCIGIEEKEGWNAYRFIGNSLSGEECLKVISLVMMNGGKEVMFE